MVGELVVQGHNDTVGHDGEDDDPLEGRPVDQPGHEPAHWTGRCEQEQRGGTPIIWLVLAGNCNNVSACKAELQR